MVLLPKKPPSLYHRFVPSKARLVPKGLVVGVAGPMMVLRMAPVAGSSPMIGLGVGLRQSTPNRAPELVPRAPRTTGLPCRAWAWSASLLPPVSRDGLRVTTRLYGEPEPVTLT